MTDVTFTVEGAQFAERALEEFATAYGPREGLNSLRRALQNHHTHSTYPGDQLHPCGHWTAPRQHLHVCQATQSVREIQ